MKVMFLVLPLIYMCANGYLYLRLLQGLALLPLWVKVIISLLFWIAAFSLFMAIVLRETQLPSWFHRALFTTGSVWMGFLLYSVMLLIVADLAKLAIPTMGHVLWYVLPATCVILLCGYFNYRHPKVEHIEVSVGKEFDGGDLRVVAISDVHLGYGTGIKSLERYVELINAQHPDLVLIVGDLVDNSIKPLIDKPFDKVLSGITAPLGVYMVPGNHEYISGIDKVSDSLKETPITLLRDSVVTLPNGVQIIGRDDRANRHRKSLEELLSRTAADRPAIVLDHQPYALAEANSLKVDMLLCGHTHHGQLFPFNLLVDCMYDQGHGYRKWSNSHIWVSSGLSLWGPPFRIGTNSDMAVIELR